jgi:hypothetical protein
LLDGSDCDGIAQHAQFLEVLVSTIVKSDDMTTMWYGYEVPGTILLLDLIAVNCPCFNL